MNLHLFLVFCVRFENIYSILQFLKNMKSCLSGKNKIIDENIFVLSKPGTSEMRFVAKFCFLY